MGSFNFPNMYPAIWISILGAQLISGQSVSPANSTTTANATNQFVLDTTISQMETHAALEPLTDQAGLKGSVSQLQQISPQGSLVLTNTESINSLETGDIAFISCEPIDYSTGNIDSQRIINLAVNNGRPVAIVLYSVYAASCSFSPTDDFSFTMMYTMLSANQSQAIVTGLQRNDPPYPSTTITVNQKTVNGSSGSSGSSGSDNNNIPGKSPTTAVAMIILYSITGIITALFLAIIIVGAIRAHRHPERYGPRRVIGRPRQSRAKGIARAMLETIPIVKFGDQEEDKPAEQGRDVELAHTGVPYTETAAEVEEPREQAATSQSDAAEGAGPGVVITEAAAGSEKPRDGAEENTYKTDNGLACSVCTDDFAKGQDVRLLPCKHKFHPECIDPWLLNVSGTCPLCRVDLHPTTSHTSDPDAEDDTSETSHPDATSPTSPTDAPITETARRNRRSRILHIGRMRHATPDERIAALRTLRNENRDQATSANIEQGGWSVGERTLNRLGVRLSRAFGGSRPASGLPSSRPVSHVPAPAAETPAITTVEAPVSSELPTSTTTEAPASTELPPASTTEAHASSKLPASTTTEAPVSTTTEEAHAPQTQTQRQD